MIRLRVTGGTRAALEADLVRRAGELLGSRVVVEGPDADLSAWGIKPFADVTSADAVVLDDPSDLPAGDPMEVRFAHVGGSHLDRWRSDVACWAEAPSAPIDDSTRSAVLAAAARRDWPGVLRALEACEASDGSRFETWAWADRLLAVDLAKDVGRQQPSQP